MFKVVAIIVVIAISTSGEVHRGWCTGLYQLPVHAGNLAQVEGLVRAKPLVLVTELLVFISELLHLFLHFVFQRYHVPV